MSCGHRLEYHDLLSLFERLGFALGAFLSLKNTTGPTDFQKCLVQKSHLSDRGPCFPLATNVQARFSDVILHGMRRFLDNGDGNITLLASIQGGHQGGVVASSSWHAANFKVSLGDHSLIAILAQAYRL